MSKAITDEIKEKLVSYFSRCRFPIVLAYLFGSHACGQAQADSDIDVAVLLDEPDRSKRLAMFRPLVSELCDALGQESVDVCLLTDEQNSLVFNAIKNGELVFCSDDAKRTELEERVFLRHFDAQTFEHIFLHYLSERIDGHRMGRGGADMIDKKAVQNRLLHIDEMLRRLRRHGAIPLDEFIKNETVSDAALYELQTCLEAVSDIATHIVAGANLGKPDDRADAVRLLSRHSIISEQLTDRLVSALRMRNIIVHGYLHVVLRTVYETIQNDLGDIEDFCAAVQRYVERPEE